MFPGFSWLCEIVCCFWISLTHYFLWIDESGSVMLQWLRPPACQSVFTLCCPGNWIPQKPFSSLSPIQSSFTLFLFQKERTLRRIDVPLCWNDHLIICKSCLLGIQDPLPLTPSTCIQPSDAQWSLKQLQRDGRQQKRGSNTPHRDGANSRDPKWTQIDKTWFGLKIWLVSCNLI